VNILLISTYELGRQPFGLASPAAWLRAAGHEVRALDLSRQELDQVAVRSASLVCFYLPMHTATRLAMSVIPRVRELNPAAPLCAYGLYAPVNVQLLRKMGVATILGGEFEEGLVRLAGRLKSDGAGAQVEPEISLARLKFLVPERDGLPPLEKYAHLTLPDGSTRVVGYTEASRGCKHLCRHCPIVPVYNGAFRIVQKDVVLEDIRRQVSAGAQHVTFGDPDFFNGPAHGLGIVRELHGEHPALTYDATIKVEHLLRHATDLPTLRATGCAFVTTAVESLDDRVLALLDKGHTRADFLRLVNIMREADLFLVPTFVAFTPWLTLEAYEHLLRTLARLDLVESVPPVQLAIRLLIPAGSRLLELPEVRSLVGPFDEAALTWRWQHPDPRVDQLQRDLEGMIAHQAKAGASRRTIFAEAWKLLHQAMEREGQSEVLQVPPPVAARCTIPYLTEPWYC
jgi:radical SAM superfamily enzyme YgiQ (UPF0313 family)